MAHAEFVNTRCSQPPSTDRNPPSEIVFMNDSHSSSSSHDNELQFLTDSAFSSLFDDPASSTISKGKWGADGLFMERLESFIEGQLKDIESFANREQIALDEVRKLVALPHAKYMLSLDLTLPSANETSTPNEKKSIASLCTIRSTLARLSSVLQLMYTATGLDSLLLVVSPHSVQDQVESTISEASWIGGTEVGKEFWMNLKGGGVSGARAFRLKSQMRLQEQASNRGNDDKESSFIIPKNMPSFNPMPSSTSILKSGDIKTELNSAVRQALRAASGNPLAEMRWTKPAALEELYGVRLVGWPDSIHARNPSNNSVKENRLLLDLLRSNQMRFVTKGSPQWPAEESTSTSQTTPAPTSSKESNIPEMSSDPKEISTGVLASHPFEPKSVDSGESNSSDVPSAKRPKKRMRLTES